MHEYLKKALEITEKAEQIPLSYFRQGMDVIHKADQSPVTIADRDTEQFIREALHDAFPDHGIIGEEFAAKQTGHAFDWIIDPIDGTRSFISGMPLFGMLLGLLEHGRPRMGVVRMPALGEAWTGDGTTASLNGAPIRASHTTHLNTAMVYLNEVDKILNDAPEVFARLNRAGRDRRFGYDCYPHMLLAAGHVDAVVDFDLKPFDFLPLVPVVTGAGGVITDWQGAPLTVDSDGRVLAAATPELHQELIQFMQ
ncbi:MAG TPA: inositol monophosphatase family protein [Aliiroseovarius sp.]|nr:inositol monophosphatase family protein [Aliiroseovarius sp.]